MDLDVSAYEGNDLVGLSCRCCLNTGSLEQNLKQSIAVLDTASDAVSYEDG